MSWKVWYTFIWNFRHFYYRLFYNFFLSIDRRLFQNAIRFPFFSFFSFYLTWAIKSPHFNELFWSLVVRRPCPFLSSFFFHILVSSLELLGYKCALHKGGGDCSKKGSNSFCLKTKVLNVQLPIDAYTCNKNLCKTLGYCIFYR